MYTHYDNYVLYIRNSFPVSVKEIRHVSSESESSDVEARSVGEISPPTSPRDRRTERKAIGRSASLLSTGSFMATPEWVGGLSSSVW